MRGVELFAGPGGASIGLHRAGIDAVGIEWDDHAVATRRAAGLPTVHADVRSVDPQDYAGIDFLWDFRALVHELDHRPPEPGQPRPGTCPWRRYHRLGR